MPFTPGAYRVAVLAAAGALFLSLVVPVGVMLAPIAFLGALWFHRDPERTPAGEGVLAPADGRVSVLREEGDRLRVGVFMNVTDVHVNRAPLDGDVRVVVHQPGANRPAFSKDSDRNEKVRIDCGDHELVMIAGWFARRIHPYVDPGDTLARGARIGHISFGSRVDILLPQSYHRTDLDVEFGDRVRAGETVIAQSRSSGSRSRSHSGSRDR
jgi:phosphatidylserine decarboxylase